MYLHAKSYQNTPRELNLKAIVTNWLRNDGHASAIYKEILIVWIFFLLYLFFMLSLLHVLYIFGCANVGL